MTSLLTSPLLDLWEWDEISTSMNATALEPPNGCLDVAEWLLVLERVELNSGLIPEPLVSPDSGMEKDVLSWAWGLSCDGIFIGSGGFMVDTGCSLGLILFPLYGVGG